MGVQGRTDFKNFSLVASGGHYSRDNETIKQDGARATVLKYGTVMAQVAATKKWVPLTDVTAVTTGESIARGIYIGEDIAAATLVAGDVPNCPMMVYGLPAVIDASLVVLENNLTLDTVISDDPAGADNGVVNVRRIEDDLLKIGILFQTTYDISKLEN